MHEKNENIFYYITMNENYYIQKSQKIKMKMEYLKVCIKLKGLINIKTKIQFLGSGTILREMMAGAEILQKEYKIDSEVWSVTSFNELKETG